MKSTTYSKISEKIFGLFRQRGCGFYRLIPFFAAYFSTHTYPDFNPMTRIFSQLLGCLLFATALQNCDLSPQKTISAAPMEVKSSQYAKQYCLDEAPTSCAVYEVSYPIFSKGDTMLVKTLNKSVQNYVLSVVAGNMQLPFAEALDSAAWQFIQLFEENKDQLAAIEMGYSTEIKDKVPLMNSKIVTIEMSGYSFTGGAHPYSFCLLVSYDLKNGAKPLQISDLVRDTNAVRPLLERAYKLSKGLQETDSLADVVYSEITQLPMPMNVGISPEGIRFYYNAYEVGPYAVGVSDILLTWQELGNLSDKNKWLE